MAGTLLMGALIIPSWGFWILIATGWVLTLSLGVAFALFEPPRSLSVYVLTVVSSISVIGGFGSFVSLLLYLMLHTYSLGMTLGDKKKDFNCVDVAAELHLQILVMAVVVGSFLTRGA